MPTRGAKSARYRESFWSTASSLAVWFVFFAASSIYSLFSTAIAYSSPTFELSVTWLRFSTDYTYLLPSCRAKAPVCCTSRSAAFAIIPRARLRDDKGEFFHLNYSMILTYHHSGAPRKIINQTGLLIFRTNISLVRSASGEAWEEQRRCAFFAFNWLWNSYNTAKIMKAAHVAGWRSFDYIARQKTMFLFR